MPDKVDPKTAVREEIVVLWNHKGQRLMGIFHQAQRMTTNGKRIGINLLNPGLRNRVAPNRLYVKLARALADEGFYVLRMDPAGIGDSEGDISEHPVVELWGNIQQGKFIEDVLCMNNYMIEKQGIEELYLAGSCGGAITALLLASRDDRVKGLILIDVPVTLSSARTSEIDHTSIIATNKEYRDLLVARYLKSLIKPNKWLRLFMLKVDFRAIRKVLSLKTKDFLRRNELSHAGKTAFHLPNMNPHFLPAFVCLMERKCEMIFLCGEKDTDTQLFRKGFWGVSVEPIHQYKRLCTLIEIKDANHIYTHAKSQKDLIYEVKKWMANR